MNFKVGQKVWCTRGGHYTYTDYHVVCEVVDYAPNTGSIYNLCVRVVEEGAETGGEDWWVEDKFFEPICNSAKVV